jgi:riboflavin kinase/FMN adenylyltransferase
MAIDMLPMVLYGVVQPFSGKGRGLGYPTANISTPSDLPDGVYFGFANLADYVHQPALIFIGTPTTVGDKERRIEAHLLDIEDIDYYGRPLRLSIEYFHRSNETFASVEELRTVMHADETTARVWFKAQQ